MDDALFWGLALLALAIVLLFIEVFVPSAGAIGFIAIAAAAAGVVVLWRYDPAWGITSLLGVAILGPILVLFALRIYPSTPIGRRMIGIPTEEEANAQALAQAQEQQQRAALIGREGVVRTDCRPVGVVEVDGTRYDALSETTLLPAGTRIKITSVEGAQIKVRPLA
ncbi:MAG: NfeD family protein [Phycisphaerales bacterium]|nr:NfeD family protein [Phycisphaerales bacterium]